jgi:hypothetical protein
MSDMMTDPTFEVQLPAPVLSKGEREYQAFLRLLPELLKTLRGKYVAVHDGQVVDSDADDIALIQRVHAKVGYVPIHVGLVAELQPIIRIGFRIVGDFPDGAAHAVAVYLRSAGGQIFPSRFP